ncbi:MAG: hypothetical protein ACXW32_10660 [Limisphaerales bacterium]
MSGSDQTVMVMLTVLLVTTAVIVGTFAVGLAGIWKKRLHRKAVRPLGSDGHEFTAPFLFDRPTRWMAVKCSNLQKVQNALGLHNATPCPLSEGFSRLGEHKLFISPPMKGWILVVGSSLPDVSDDVDKLYHFLMKIAGELGSVQYFSANRALSHHAWVRIENNRVYRAYGWAGETVWNQGERTAAEKELELKCHDYCDNPLPYPFTARDSHVSNTEKVMQLAARWSIDPMAVNNQNLRASFGIAGELSRR